MQQHAPATPTVSIVVCTYNRAAMLSAALQSLLGLRTDSTLTYEIVVVDDGSSDDTPAAVQSLSAESSTIIRYFRQRNAGVASARNLGVRCARGEWIAFFDDDQLADPEWLLQLYTSAQAEDADFAGGPCRLLLPAGVDPESLSRTIRWLLGENPLMTKIPSPNRWDPRRRLNSLPGTGNVLVRGKLFAAVGPFAEGRRYGEDLEFFRRAVRSGARFTIAPHAVVHHVIPPNRLTPDYLYRLAELGGRSQAEIDRTVRGLGAALWVALLRTGHLAFSVLPGLGRAIVAGNRPLALSKRCSCRFARAYIKCALNLSRSNPPRRSSVSPVPAAGQTE